METFANIVGSVVVLMMGVLAFYSIENDIMPRQPRKAFITALVMMMVVLTVIWM